MIGQLETTKLENKFLSEKDPRQMWEFSNYGWSVTRKCNDDPVDPAVCESPYASPDWHLTLSQLLMLTIP